jgi:beta-lactam-binding protein with PASTA domain
MSVRSRTSARRVGPPGFFGTLWRLVLIGGLLFAGAGAAGYAVVQNLVQTAETPAPDLLALDAATAFERASAKGFSARIAGREPSTVLESGHVVAQRPQPGTWVKEGATIQLTLAE